MTREELYESAENDRLLDLLFLRDAGALIVQKDREDLAYLLQQPGAEAVQVLYHLFQTPLDLSEQEVQAAVAGIHITLPEQAPVRTLYRKWYYAAAAAAVIGGIGTFLLREPHKDTAVAVTGRQVIQKKDIAPGGNKAVLTLANGQQIVLDASAEGSLAQQGATQVIKLDSGTLAYRQGEASGKTTAYNTITTPRAGQYIVVLPDGSKVWLNAESSLRFPVAFTGDSREVEMTGEAYFEIAQNSHQPFKVVTGQHKIDVLGTSFNISAYSDESKVSTTLLEGAVRVTNGEATQYLHPGQQAQASGNTIQLVKNPDLKDVMAWKDGVFRFNESTLDEIVKQLSRWYDIQFTFKNAHRLSDHYIGTIPRNVPLSQVLHLLELTGSVQFSIIDGNHVVVE